MRPLFASVPKNLIQFVCRCDEFAHFITNWKREQKTETTSHKCMYTLYIYDFFVKVSTFHGVYHNHLYELTFRVNKQITTPSVLLNEKFPLLKNNSYVWKIDIWCDFHQTIWLKRLSFFSIIEKYSGVMRFSDQNHSKTYFL